MLNMNKITLILLTVFAVTQGDNQRVSNQASSIENYVDVNYQLFSKTVERYEARLKHFRKNYLGRISVIPIQSEMTIASIIQTEDEFNPLKLLSDLNKHCYNKYIFKIPTVIHVETSILECVTQATNLTEGLLNNAISAKDDLKNYLVNNFIGKIKKDCLSKPHLSENYAECAVNVTSVTHDFAELNQKLFDNFLDAAECKANAYIKEAMDCSYKVIKNTHTLIAEATLEINLCMAGKDECPPCEVAHTCPESMDINIEETTISNPFYGKNKPLSCLILKAK